MEGEPYLLTRRDIVVRPEGDEGEVLLFDPETERIKVLNHTGYRVWNLCDGQHTQADVADSLSEEYATVAPDLVAADVQAFVQELLNLGFVEVVRSL